MKRAAHRDLLTSSQGIKAQIYLQADWQMMTSLEKELGNVTTQIQHNVGQNKRPIKLISK